MPNRTALYPLHTAAGAKFVQFAGWDMPLHYGSQIAEHEAVRRDCGMFDVSHMGTIDIVGRAATGLLERALANDVAKIQTPGRALYSCLLDDTGGVRDDLIAYHVGVNAYRLVVNAATRQTDHEQLVALASTPDVRLVSRTDLAMIAVQGPNARERCWQAMPGLREATVDLVRMNGAFLREMFVARTGYTGEDGFEIILPAVHAPGLWERLEAARVRPCGLGARDTLRLEAGMALNGVDMDASVTPFEAGLGWTVDRSRPRAFVGRAALDARARRVRLVGLVLRDTGVMRHGQTVQTVHGDGVITSGSYAPSLRRSIALARVPPATVEGETVQVDLRGRTASASVVRYPFVRNGRSLIADTFEGLT